MPQPKLGIALKRIVSSFHCLSLLFEFAGGHTENYFFKHESTFTSVISGKLSGTNATFPNNDCKDRSKVCWISVTVGAFTPRSFWSVPVGLNAEPNMHLVWWHIRGF